MRATTTCQVSRPHAACADVLQSPSKDSRAIVASSNGEKDCTLNVSFLQELLSSVAEQSRALLPKSLFGADAGEDVEALTRALVSGRGEASGVAIARELLDRYARLDAEERLRFFTFLATQMRPDPEGVVEAARAHLEHPSDASLATLQKALESPRVEFFRRLNLAPGATHEIVGMRHDLLRVPPTDPALAAVDADLRRLFYAWFNRGFLVLRRIDWNTPAAILDKIIRYEAVHAIQGWDDLRRRLDPADRRCFAFFHPSLVDEPLVFVEVALMRDMPDAIGQVLEEPHAELPGKPPTTAVFYSISNCQEGLKGITFGNFLLKQVVEELAREKPSLKNFVTLSPVPQFAAWLESVAAEPDADAAAGEARALLELMRRTNWPEGASDSEYAEVETALMVLAAHYFLNAKAAGRAPGRSRRPLPSRQRRPSRPHQFPRRHLGKEHARGLRPDGQLPLRPQGHRAQSRGLRQRGRRRLLARRAQPAEAQAEGPRPSPTTGHSRRRFRPRSRKSWKPDPGRTGCAAASGAPCHSSGSPCTMGFAPTPTDVARASG